MAKGEARMVVTMMGLALRLKKCMVFVWLWVRFCWFFWFEKMGWWMMWCGVVWNCR